MFMVMSWFFLHDRSRFPRQPAPTVNPPAHLNHVPYDREGLFSRLTVLEWALVLVFCIERGDSDVAGLLSYYEFPARFFLVRLGVGSFVITCLIFNMQPWRLRALCFDYVRRGLALTTTEIQLALGLQSRLIGRKTVWWP